MEKKNLSAIEQVKNYQMCRVISLVIAIQGMIMMVLNIFSKSYNSAWVSLIYSTAMFISFFLVTWKKNLNFFYHTIFPVVLYIEITFLLTGGTEGFGIIWMLVVPLFSLYLLSDRWFFSTNAIILLILVVSFFTPINKYTYQFKPSFMIRFPLVYIFAYMFAGFLKFRIKRTENELQEQKDILSREIQQAAIIQKAFLSQPKVDLDGWDVAFDNSPLQGVSGDFYDIYKTKTKLHGAGLFDISGHGISSGLITMLIKNIIQQEFSENKKEKLNDIVQRINDRFINEKGNIENYLTGIIIRVNDNKIELVNAGHPLPILYHKQSGKFEIIEKEPLAMGAIGLKNFPSIFESQTFTMEQGDELILYTDGITDAKNEQGISFGRQNLINTLEKYSHFPISEQICEVFNSVTTYQNNLAPTDDMSIVILKKL